MRREIVSAVFPLLLPLFFFFLLVSRSLLFRYLASATTLRPAVESRSNVFSSRLNFTLARPGSGRRLSPADALRYTAIGCAIYPRSANTQPEIAESWSSYRSASFERKASDCPTVHGSRYTYRFAFGDEIGSEKRRRRRRRRGIALDDSSSISKVRKSVIDPARTGAIYDIQHMIFDLSVESQSRYLVHNYENGALLRIEPVRPVRDNTMYECLAENGVGDAVSAEAQLRVYEGTCPFFSLSLFFLTTLNLNDYSGETWRRWSPLRFWYSGSCGGNLIFNESGMVGNRWRWCWRHARSAKGFSQRRGGEKFGGRARERRRIAAEKDDRNRERSVV